jgi:hypothetical protein
MYNKIIITKYGVIWHYALYILRISNFHRTWSYNFLISPSNFLEPFYTDSHLAYF